MATGSLRGVLSEADGESVAIAKVEAGGPMSYGTDILDMSAGTKHNRQSSW
jgi:thymidine phosphorylase